eukprot:2240853-Pleurochrysis_carterae.AAC.1
MDKCRHAWCSMEHGKLKVTDIPTAVPFFIRSHGISVFNSFSTLRWPPVPTRKCLASGRIVMCLVALAADPGLAGNAYWVGAHLFACKRQVMTLALVRLHAHDCATL